jgi:hypothetical protein
MKTVKREKLNPIYSETIHKKYPKIILDGVIHEFVGIGWVECGKANARDRKTLPVVVD